MNADQLAKAYEQFFTKSEAGKHFTTTLTTLLSTNHEDAEKNPELARDYVQRAKGVREVTDHIHSVMTTAKKGRL